MSYYPPEGYRTSGSFAQWNGADAPEPKCRKYHITAYSNDADDEHDWTDHAKAIATVVLPELRDRRIAHKIATNQIKYWNFDSDGSTNAGKLITIYMHVRVQVENPDIMAIDQMLIELSEARGIRPHRSQPINRHELPSASPVYEQQVGASGFIFGGIEVDTRSPDEV